MTKDEQRIEDRRSEDARLLRIETLVNNINTKVNNGLSERSKETIIQVQKLDEKQDALENVLVEHISESNLVRRDISAIKDSLTAVAETQQGWIKLFNRGGIVIAGLLAGVVIWILINIDAIDKVMDHILSAIN